MGKLPCSLLLLLLTIYTVYTTLALSPDGLALLAFKSAVSDDPSSSLADWTEDDVDPCHWPGVTCANISGFPFPRVVGLAVSSKNISGYIPSELGSLLFLRRLNLHGNRLTGPIPLGLANASSLHSLFLYGNSLSGPFPSNLCYLPRLQNLDLSFNSLDGPIPIDLRNCRQLQRLLLSGNGFSGEIPTGVWPEMTNLVQLDLSSNRLNGSIPPDLSKLDSLGGTLNLSHNHLSGEIPAELGRLPSTVSLDLRFNDLSGEIPQAGSLVNQGPTAFLNNAGLCGFPLQIPCQEPPPPPVRPDKTPAGGGPAEERKGLRTSLIVLISVADAAGVALIGVVMVYIYWKLRDREKGGCACCTGKSRRDGNSNTCCCRCWYTATAGGSEEEEEDDDGDDDEQGKEGELIAIDKGFKFELDELLRSSAYVLGKGGKGIVYKVVVGNGIPVAVRRLGAGAAAAAGEGGAGQRYKEFAAEAQAIGKVRHTNVVKLRAYYWSQDEKLLITDFISNGNLATALRGRSGQPSLSWQIRLKIAKGAARGLAHLHECSPKRFVHGDIKPSNVLLDGDYNPYISDFGLNRLVTIAGSSDTAPYLSLQSSAKKPSGPLDRPNSYQAPEARLPGAKPAQKWDVYSLGVIMMELLTGKPPELASPSSSSAVSSVLGSEYVPELVRWVRKGFEDARPLAEMVDPVFLRESHGKKEVISVFHVALACTEADPEQRPKMKTVSENLDKVGP